MISMTEIIRLQDAPVIHELHTIQRDYTRMAFPGSDDPVRDEEMESMREGHTGTLPWQRERSSSMRTSSYHTACVRHSKRMRVSVFTKATGSRG